MSENRITAMVDDYAALLERKEELAEQVKVLNEEIEASRRRLTDAMVEEEIDGIDRNGVSWKLRNVTKYSKKAGADEELFELLRAEGLGDIIKETVNPQTLQGAMSELASNNDDELPEEFKECVNVFEFMDVSHRKITRKK